MERVKDASNILKKTVAVGLASAALAACGTYEQAAEAIGAGKLVEIPRAPSEYKVVTPAYVIEEKLETAWRDAASRHSSDVDIAVYDHESGAVARYTNTNETFHTASIIKLSILAKTLMDNQAHGSSALDQSERQSAVPMITYSDNGTATRLWHAAGGATGMQAFFDRVGATGTQTSTSWGLTQTTALDQLRVVSSIAYPGALLTPESAAEASGLMSDVIPSQRWGISGGVPESVSYGLKNGWLPGIDCTINSIGHVYGEGADYTIAVLTNDSPSMQAGIDTIESLAAATWAVLGDTVE